MKNIVQTFLVICFICMLDGCQRVSAEYTEEWKGIITEMTYTPEYIFETIDEVKLPNGEIGQKGIKRLYPAKRTIKVEGLNGKEGIIEVNEEIFKIYNLKDSINVLTRHNIGKTKISWGWNN